jgi:hypothetical protein
MGKENINDPLPPDEIAAFYESSIFPGVDQDLENLSLVVARETRGLSGPRLDWVLDEIASSEKYFKILMRDSDAIAALLPDWQLDFHKDLPIPLRRNLRMMLRGMLSRMLDSFSQERDRDHLLLNIRNGEAGELRLLSLSKDQSVSEHAIARLLELGLEPLSRANILRRERELDEARAILDMIKIDILSFQIPEDR